MVFYISLFLILWLAAGFAVGMKQVYVDQLFDKAVIERLEKEANDHGHADRMIKQRVLYIAAVTVSGFISVYYEMKTIPQRRNIRKIEKNIMKLNQAKKTKNEEKIKSAQAKGQVHFCFVWKMGEVVPAYFS